MIRLVRRIDEKCSTFFAAISVKKTSFNFQNRTLLFLTNFLPFNYDDFAYVLMINAINYSQELEFHGVMRFYYQSQDDSNAAEGQKVATKCIRVSSTATTKAIIETLIEKFRPDMRMLEVPEYALYEIHESGERRLNLEEKPLLVQLNWHKDDREGRFLLRRIDEPSRLAEVNASSAENPSFKRKLSKREKKELKKQEKLQKQRQNEMAQNGQNNHNNQDGVAEKLYTGKNNYKLLLFHMRIKVNQQLLFLVLLEQVPHSEAMKKLERQDYKNLL